MNHTGMGGAETGDSENTSEQATKNHRVGEEAGSLEKNK